MTRHYQNDTKIPTYSSTRDTQGVEDSNHLGWTSPQKDKIITRQE